MMDEEKLPDFKPIVTVIWIGVLTAILVTILDWKIKQDILRITDAFYRVQTDKDRDVETEQEMDRPGDTDRVLPLRRVDNDSRVETRVLFEKNPPTFSTAQPGIFRGFPPEFQGNVQSGTAADSERLSPGSVELSGSEPE